MRSRTKVVVRTQGEIVPHGGKLIAKILNMGSERLSFPRLHHVSKFLLLFFI